MSLPDWVTLTCVLVVLFWFLAVAKRKYEEINDLDDFLFYGRALEAKGYSRTFVATGLSLATVLTFFLDFGGQYGMALLVSPVAYLIGVWLLLRALPAMRKTGYIARGSTLHSFLGQTFGSDSVRLISASISLLGYLGILIIELHVGVEIFRVIYDSPAGLIGTIVLLFVVILLYTWLSGYRAVVDTDRIQLRLITLGLMAGLVFLVYSVARQVEIESFPIHLLNPSPLNLPLSLLVVMLVGNIPLQIVRMSNWQRIATVGDEVEVRTGLTKAIWMTFFFWLAFNIMGVLLQALEPEASGLRTVYLLSLLESYGGVAAFLFYPMLFVGLAAALISTADSVFVPILTVWVYDFKRHSELHTADGWSKADNDVALRDHLAVARRSIKWFLLATVLLYAALRGLAQFDFISFLFVFFNQQLVLFPLVISGLGGERTRKDRSVVVITLGGTVLGWCAVWALTVWGSLTGNNDLVFYAAPIGFGVSLALPLALSRGVRENMSRGIRRLVLAE